MPARLPPGTALLTLVALFAALLPLQKFAAARRLRLLLVQDEHEGSRRRKEGPQSTDKAKAKAKDKGKEAKETEIRAEDPPKGSGKYMTAQEESEFWTKRYDSKIKVDGSGVNDLVEYSKTWCHSSEVPKENRAPKKIQGLYWLYGLPFQDPLACFSNGMWYPEKRLLRIWLWKSFMWYNSTIGRDGAYSYFKQGTHYDFKFTDDTLSSAKTDLAGLGTAGKFRMAVWDSALEFPFIEKKQSNASGPGLIWVRPSYALHVIRIHTYEAWKVLDADKKPIKDHVKKMVEYMNKDERSKRGVVRYFNTLKAKYVEAEPEEDPTPKPKPKSKSLERSRRRKRKKAKAKRRAKSGRRVRKKR